MRTCIRAYVEGVICVRNMRTKIGEVYSMTMTT